MVMIMHASSAEVTYWNVAARPTGCVQVGQSVSYYRVTLAERAFTYLHRLSVAQPRKPVLIERVLMVALRLRLGGYAQALECINEGHMVPKFYSLYILSNIRFLPAIALERAVICERTCDPFSQLEPAFLHEISGYRVFRSPRVCCSNPALPDVVCQRNHLEWWWR